MKFDFDWREFTEKDFVNYCAMVENDQILDNDYVGCVRVGELCFDFVYRYDGEQETLDYDMYLGGVDTGYGYSKIDGTPYTEGGGGIFEDGLLIGLSYDEFKQTVEKTITNFIVSENNDYRGILVPLAKAPLHIW